MYRNLASFRQESRFGTWLYRIVTNAALMHRRARTRRPVESLEAFLPEFDATGCVIWKGSCSRRGDCSCLKRRSDDQL